MDQSETKRKIRQDRAGEAEGSLVDSERASYQAGWILFSLSGGWLVLVIIIVGRT